MKREREARLTATDLLGEALEERSRALDVAELEYALEDLWDWVRDCRPEWRKGCTYDLVFISSRL